MMALLCIEPPQSLSDSNSIRDEKVKVLKSVKRFTTAQAIKDSAIRARYSEGSVNGEKRLSYKDLDGVSEDSTTETLACLRLEIDNWRWSGVPIYVRAGKSLPKRATQILVYFKKAPGSLLSGVESKELSQNVLAIQVQPDEGITLTINSKPPGPELSVKPVEMDFDYGESFNVALPDAYERLLLDAMKGDSTLFTRDDEIEQAWEILDPILSSWENTKDSPLYEYKAGSWGPDEVDDFIGQTGHKWSVF